MNHEKRKLPIRYINHGLGFRYNDRIEINRRLLDHPKWYKFVLDHELNHTNKSWSLKDFILDLTDFDFGLFLWTLRTPSTWTQFSPYFINKKEKKIYINYNIVLLYIVFSFVLTMLYYI